MNTPCVYIVILNWNGWRDTSECLKSVSELDYPTTETVVVDNASTDNSVRKLKERHPAVKVLENRINSGFSGGNNIGLRHALEHGADLVWLLNNDTVVDSRALTELVTRIEEDETIGICGSSLLYYHQRDTIQALGGGSYNKWFGTTAHLGAGKNADGVINTEDVEEKLDYIVGASMLVTRSFLEDIGLLNEEYFLYYEELDWAIRARNRYRLGYAKESIVYHKVGASIKGDNRDKRKRSRMSDYYQLKNRLKFTWNYFPGMLFSVYLSVVGAVVNRILRGQWDRVGMILKLMIDFNKDDNTIVNRD